MAMLTCPVCAATISWWENRLADSLACSACGRWLKVPTWYQFTITWIGLAVTGFVLFTVGVRGLTLLLLTLILSVFPMIVLGRLVAVRVFPPRLRIVTTDDDGLLHLAELMRSNKTPDREQRRESGHRGASGSTRP